MKRKAFIIHNLSASNLKLADEFGGIVNPSLALITNEFPLNEDFGEITLVLDKSKLDDKNHDCYEFDSYSQRCPKIFWELNHQELAKFSEQLNEIFTLYKIPQSFHTYLKLYDGKHSDTTHLEDGIYRKNVNLLSNMGLQLKYCHNNNIEISIPIEEKPMSIAYFKRETIKELASNGFFKDNSLENRQNFLKHESIQRDFRSYILSLYDDIDRAELSDADIEQEMRFFMDSVYFHDGALSLSAFYDLESDSREDSFQVDYSEFRNNLERILPSKEAYEEWVSKELAKCYLEPYFYNDKREKIKATLDNLSDFMKGKTQSEENELFTSAGKIRSALTGKKNSLDELLSTASSFVSHDEFQIIRKNTNSMMHELVDNLSHKYRFNSNSMLYRDAAINAILTYAKTNSVRELNLDYRVDDDLIGDIGDFFNTLRNTPTEYCEIKLNEPLKIQDFSDAIVKNDTPKHVIDVLSASGVRIHQIQSAEDKKRILLLTGKGIGDLGNFKSKANDRKSELTK